MRRPGSTTVRDLLANCADMAAARDRVSEQLDTALEEVRAALVTDGVTHPARPSSTWTVPPGSVGASTRYLRQHSGSSIGSAAIIDVLIALGEIERAWLVALEFGADTRWWAHLAELRANDHPQDAVDWAMVAAQLEIDRKGRPHYRRAVRHLRAVQTLAAKHDGDEHGPLSQRFHAGVRSIVWEHSNKPSLLDEFAKAGWPAS